MGEIGISERKFLYHYKHWQLQAILKGYRKRTHEMQLLTRWQTWALLKGFCGIEADEPKDLMTLPCDPRDPDDTPSDDDINKLIKECQEYNDKLKEANEDKDTDSLH